MLDNVSWGNSTEPDTINPEIINELEYKIHNTKKNFKYKLKLFFLKKFFPELIPNKYKSESKKPIPISNFFDDVKNSVNYINKDDIDEILGKYNLILNDAKTNKQTALVEKIEDYASVLKTELILCGSKFNRYITEDSLVKFHDIASVHEKYKTGLCLTYVKNFVKIIPNEVTKLKCEADELKVFDNYVVLHYDYNGKAVEKTKKEKDPILFGVIKDSNKLYYIGDWIDEYCDLTLDVIIKTIGSEHVNEIHKESIIKNIGKI